MNRIGFGQDIHRLDDNGRTLYLGGVQIPSNFGPVSHSDGDVLLHAVMESLLGALALGDLGTYFPDNEIKYKNISSVILLNEVLSMVKDKGYSITNIDTNIILEKPKLKNYISTIRNSLADLLKINLDQVAVKAQTNEQCDEVGKGRAIIAQAVVLLEKE